MDCPTPPRPGRRPFFLFGLKTMSPGRRRFCFCLKPLAAGTLALAQTRSLDRSFLYYAKTRSPLPQVCFFCRLETLPLATTVFFVVKKAFPWLQPFLFSLNTYHSWPEAVCFFAYNPPMEQRGGKTLGADVPKYRWLKMGSRPFLPNNSDFLEGTHH